MVNLKSGSLKMPGSITKTLQLPLCQAEAHSPSDTTLSLSSLQSDLQTHSKVTTYSVLS